MKSRYKIGDIVLAKSVAGEAIFPVHHKLVKRIIVKPSKGKTINWTGYSGWETILVSAEEVKYLKQEWNIPYTEPEKDLVFVYDECILKRVKQVKVSQKILNKLTSVKKIKRGRNGKRKKAKKSTTKEK
jgi:hypothetical protein